MLLDTVGWLLLCATAGRQSRDLRAVLRSKINGLESYVKSKARVFCVTKVTLLKNLARSPW